MMPGNIGHKATEIQAGNEGPVESKKVVYLGSMVWNFILRQRSNRFFSGRLIFGEQEGQPFSGRNLFSITTLGLLLLLLVGCGGSDKEEKEEVNPDHTQTCSCTEKKNIPSSLDGTGFPTHRDVRGLLMATRFATLEELKTVIEIEYFHDTTLADTVAMRHGRVMLTHCSDGIQVTSELKSGVSEGDIKKARDGSVWKKMGLGYDTPFGIRNRRDLQKVYILSRRRPNLYGAGDPAFFDLAETSVANINTPHLAFRNPRDTTEKGYLNTFNHVTAQAFITTMFSEDMADFVADVHERHHMPELIIGKFTEKQLTDPDKNPVDNYVDIINNEWGQELGKDLKEKHQITSATIWTPELLATYLNDLQSYYSWALQIGFKPYRPEDEVVTQFAEKINIVMKGVSLKVR